MGKEEMDAVLGGEKPGNGILNGISGNNDFPS